MSIVRAAPDPKRLEHWVRRHYPFRGAPRCALVQDGVNLTYKVADRGGKFILRIYRPGWRTARQIAFELGQLRDLAGRGLPVSVPLPSKRGAWSVPLTLPAGRTRAALFTFATGTIRMKPAKAAAAEAGMLLGALHSAMDASPARPPSPPLDARALTSAPLARLPRRSPEFGTIHADSHVYNMRFDRTRGASVIFDFDMITRGWRIFDLATYLWTVARSAKELREKSAALVAASDRFRPLGPAERRALPDMIAARQTDPPALLALRQAPANPGGRAASRPGSGRSFSPPLTGCRPPSTSPVRS